MIKFISILLDIIALSIVVITMSGGESNFLLFPCILFWFNTVCIFLLLFVCGDFYQKNYEHNAITWRVYDVVSNILFVLSCFYLGWLWLGGFLLIMSISKASKVELMEQQLKSKKTGDAND